MATAGGRLDPKGPDTMIQENEVVMLLLGVGVLIFILVNRVQLRRLPASGLHVTALCVLLAGWVLTVLEGFFWQEWLNFFEHRAYATSSVLLAAWCWSVVGGRSKGGT